MSFSDVCATASTSSSRAGPASTDVCSAMAKKARVRDGGHADVVDRVRAGVVAWMDGRCDAREDGVTVKP